MQNIIIIKHLAIIAVLAASCLNQANAHESDTIPTAKGKIVIHFLGHGSLMFEYEGKVIYIDPFSGVADYKTLPKADLILITHHHGDHLDSTALADIYKESATIYWTQECQKVSKFQKYSKTLLNGSIAEYAGIKIKAVPAYNIVNKRPNGTPFHPKGEGNGYILTFEDMNVYIAGDTENIPEMNSLGRVDIAFLPVNLPYTMTPAMLLDAAKVLKPRVLYPYHFGNTDMQKTLDLFKDEKDIEVRLRKLE